MTRILRDRRPIEFHQVCAIARVVLLKDLGLSDAEWKAQTRETAAKQGYDEPATDMLARALSSVEQALLRTMGPRLTTTGTRKPAVKADKVPLTSAEWKAFAATLRGVVARSQAVLPSNVTPIARETLEISEHAALDQFYAEANTGDRLGALRRFAEIAIVRDADWDPAAVRAAVDNHPLRARGCFACRGRSMPIAWHHVIQIQHGGSNLLRNRVALCGPCHSEIHPWLPKQPRRTDSWSRLADVYDFFAAMCRNSKRDAS